MMVILHELLCAALFYSIFCRSVHTSCNTTRLSVRLAIWAIGIVACVGMAAPIAWGWHPDWFTMLLLATICGTQFVFASVWSNGVPAQFRKASAQS